MTGTWKELWKVFEPLLPRVAGMTDDLGGVLVGGTALAIHLEHRPSFDIDVQVVEDFDSNRLAGRLSRDLGAHVETTATNYVQALADGIKVEIWKSRYTETPIETGPIVSGIGVASLPDLFALKLRAVVDRKQFRDFYDIATLMERVMPLKEGLRCYAYRFGRLLTYEEVGEVLSALRCPSQYIPPDPNFEHNRRRVLTAIGAAVEEALGWITSREGTHQPTTTPPTSPRNPPD